MMSSVSVARACSHLGAPQTRPVVQQPTEDLPPICHCAPVHQQVLQKDQVDQGVQEVGVVQVLPVHRGEEEELGGCVQDGKYRQEGAKEEISEADAPPDVKADHAPKGDVDEDHHGGDEHEHGFNNDDPCAWRTRNY